MINKRPGIKCSTCDSIFEPRDRRYHPTTGVPQCSYCHANYIQVGDLSQYRGGVETDGLDNYCRSCFDGGELILCHDRKCRSGFCQDCIKRILGPEKLVAIQNNEDWYCMVCDYTQLDHLEIRRALVLPRPSLKTTIKLKEATVSEKLKIVDTPIVDVEEPMIVDPHVEAADKLKVVDTPTANVDEPVIVDSLVEKANKLKVVGKPTADVEEPVIVDSPVEVTDEPEKVDTPTAVVEEPVIVDSPVAVADELTVVDTPTVEVEEPLTVDSPVEKADKLKVVDTPTVEVEEPLTVDSPVEKADKLKVVETLTVDDEEPVIVDSPVEVTDEPEKVDTPTAVVDEPVVVNPPIETAVEPMIVDSPTAVAVEPVIVDPPIEVANETETVDTPITIAAEPVKVNPPSEVAVAPMIVETSTSVVGESVVVNPPIEKAVEPVIIDTPSIVVDKPVKTKQSAKRKLPNSFKIFSTSNMCSKPRVEPRIEKPSIINEESAKVPDRAPVNQYPKSLPSVSGDSQILADKIAEAIKKNIDVAEIEKELDLSDNDSEYVEASDHLYSAILPSATTSTTTPVATTSTAIEPTTTTKSAVTSIENITDVEMRDIDIVQALEAHTTKISEQEKAAGVNKMLMAAFRHVNDLKDRIQTQVNSLKSSCEDFDEAKFCDNPERMFSWVSNVESFLSQSKIMEQHCQHIYKYMPHINKK